MFAHPVCDGAANAGPAATAMQKNATSILMAENIFIDDFNLFDPTFPKIELNDSSKLNENKPNKILYKIKTQRKNHTNNKMK